MEMKGPGIGGDVAGTITPQLACQVPTGRQIVLLPDSKAADLPFRRALDLSSS